MLPVTHLNVYKSITSKACYRPNGVYRMPVCLPRLLFVLQTSLETAKFPYPRTV